MEQIRFKKTDYRTDMEENHYHINYRNFFIFMGVVFLFGAITGLIAAHMLYCGTL